MEVTVKISYLKVSSGFAIDKLSLIWYSVLSFNIWVEK